MSLLEVVGQDSAIRLLLRAYQSQRMPHSYIFHGPEGVGKGLLARQWSKLLLCSQTQRRDWPADRPGGRDLGQYEDACGSCPDCHLVAAGNHPDLHIITKELVKHTSQGRDRQTIELPIDVIREFVIEQAGVYPSRNRARIFIIEEADSMTRGAQNSLLKTLEEPPVNTFLFLLSEKIDRLLPTIRSRCQPVRFGSLPGEFLVSRLQEAGCPAAQAAYWSDFSEGSLGVALELAGLGLYENKCELVRHLAELEYDSVLETAGWLVEQAKEYAEKQLKANPDLSQSATVRRGQKFYLQMMAHAFHLVIRRLAEGGGSDGGAADQAVEIDRMARMFGLRGASQAIRGTERAARLLNQNVNVSLIFESLMLQCLNYSKKRKNAGTAKSRY